MASQTVSVTATTSGDGATVWALLADAAGWPQWSRIDSASLERAGDDDPNGVGAVRRMKTGPLTIREQITRFDAPTAMDYTLLSGLPLDDYHAQVRLAEHAGATTITWSATFRPRIPGTGLLMRMMAKRILSDIAGALAKGAAAQRAS